MSTASPPSPAPEGAAPRDTWSGAPFLASVEGEVSRFPPLRVLFLAWRVQATGLLRIAWTAPMLDIHLQKGRICGISGLRGVIAELDPSFAEFNDLVPAVGEAIKLGISPQDAMDAARRRFVRQLAEWIEPPAASIRFAPHVPAFNAAFPPEWNVPRLLDDAVRSSATVERTTTLVTRFGTQPVRAILPDDSPEESWAFDALTSRVLHLATNGGAVQDLVGVATAGNPARRPEVLVRLHLLRVLGLVVIEEPVVPRPAFGGESSSSWRLPRRNAPPPAESPFRTDAPTRPVPASPAPATPGEKALASLQESVKHMRSVSMLSRLGLDAAKAKPTPEAISTAFREVSKQYHPDRFTDARPETARMAAEAFGLINDAAEALTDPEVLADEWRRLECERQGIPYVSAGEYIKARVAFKRGELQFRNREFAIAEACFAEAVRWDPAHAGYQEIHLFSAYLAKQLGGNEAIERLDRIERATPVQRASIEVTAGRILRLEQAAEAKVLERFRKALALDPENRDAQRESRLQDMRKGPEPVSWKGLFSKLTRKGDKETK